ncbi:hypothetical protein GAY33_05375 [Azospirillum brasilense]|uniref:hypothetical protein n=1 Tax=Azospirillum argentinense TaxID=2970906 RepID=UPI00190A4D88|nr:hypothetical protein [Azospirillum argentinense]MBK3798667.1 hypothetical protein [Azospirillum argentinense]
MKRRKQRGGTIVHGHYEMDGARHAARAILIQIGMPELWALCGDSGPTGHTLIGGPGVFHVDLDCLDRVHFPGKTTDAAGHLAMYDRHDHDLDYWWLFADDGAAHGIMMCPRSTAVVLHSGEARRQPWARSFAYPDPTDDVWSGGDVWLEDVGPIQSQIR